MYRYKSCLTWGMRVEVDSKCDMSRCCYVGSESGVVRVFEVYERMCWLSRWFDRTYIHHTLTIQ